MSRTDSMPKFESWVLKLDPELKEADPAQTYANTHIKAQDTAAVDSEFQHRFGRRYHGQDADAYLLPNDNEEQSRLNNQYEVVKLAMNGSLSMVDIKRDVKNILDVGCGTGVWSIEMAEAYPHAKVVGIDLSTIQPESRPENCVFVKGDVEKEWQFDHKFNLIHARLLTFGLRDWDTFFKRCFDNLEPGGWIESIEFCLPIHRSDEEEEQQSAFMDFTRLWADCALQVGLNARVADGFAMRLQEAGFCNIERVDMQFPLTSWPTGEKYKAMGRRMVSNTTGAMKSYAGTVKRVMGYSDEQVDALCVDSLKDVLQGHYYCPVLHYKAQRPHRDDNKQ